MSMFGPKEGSWWMRSKKDPRWNCDGRGLLLFSAGIPDEAKEKIEELKKKYGEPPDDLEFGGMKD
jgi:hypothetical protein